jgi:hypothetical protein
MKARRRKGVVCSKPTGRSLGRTNFLQSFHPEFRNQVRQLVERASCFADLATTFPGLLFALATGYGSVDAREAALQRVEAGSALKHAAEALGLPWWLRRLPPQAFTEHLTALPGDMDFSTRIANLLPSAPGQSGSWLERVQQAYRTCDASFALWIARHERLHASPGSDATLPFLAAWAWHSSHPETPGGRILRRPWTPSISPRRALEEMTIWRKRIALAISLAATGHEPWLEGASVNGYDFVPLRTVEEFIAESQAMENCLDGFADKIDTGNSFVFSIRVEGKPVADVEIGAHPVDMLRPTIIQLRGRRNRLAKAALWKATYAWLASQAMAQPPSRRPSLSRRRQAWREFWKPYLDVLGERDRAEFERLALEIDRIRLTRSRRLPAGTARRPRRAT